MLSQVQGGFERVIGYNSRTLSKSERNYSTTRKVLLAILESVKSYRHFLYGRRFTIKTDHNALKCVKSIKNQCARSRADWNSWPCLISGSGNPDMVGTMGTLIGYHDWQERKRRKAERQMGIPVWARLWQLEQKKRW